MFNTKVFETIVFWCREREAIRIRKERGEAPPWTEDAILRDNRFCNVRREDDAVTRWIAEHIRKPFANDRNLWLMLCTARWINKTNTLAELISTAGAWPRWWGLNVQNLLGVLDAITERGEAPFGGAYTIPAVPPNHVTKFRKKDPKNEYVATFILGSLWKDRLDYEDYFASGEATVQGTTERLAARMGWGDFMAYQVVVDMTHTCLLRRASDVETWAAAGPGTRRGLNRLHGRDIDHNMSQEQALKEMRALDKALSEELGWTDLDFSDVPNVLCEADKYIRARDGEGRMRQRYTPRPAARVALLNGSGA